MSSGYDNCGNAQFPKSSDIYQTLLFKVRRQPPAFITQVAAGQGPPPLSLLPLASA